MDKLGIEPIQLLTQVINFIIMVFVLQKLLYKPIIKMLEERKKKIADGLAYAEEMKTQEEKTEKKRQEVLNKAKEEAREVIEDGKKEGKRLSAEIVQKAHDEAAEIVEKGKKDVELERADMEMKLRDKTVEIAEMMVMRVLADTLTEKNQKTIIDKKLKEISRNIK